MNSKLPFLSQRLFNAPLALHPAKAEIIVAAVAERFGVSRLIRLDGGMAEAEHIDDGSADMSIEADYRPYEIINEVAVIPVEGTLVNKLGTMRPWSGMTGYDGIRMNLAMALNDEHVKAIVLDIESPGGEVAGCFDLVDDIYRARGIKPIWANLSEYAYSAAYAIASACDRINVPRTGGVGSVGVICAAIEYSKALDAAGWTVTLITYGDRKADGSQYIPLSKEALERFQADVNEMGDLFVETVARNRGITAKSIKDTQAATYMGINGVEKGLADYVISPDAAFRELLNTIS